MSLWFAWMQAVRSLRPACRRSRTFLWMVLTLMGLCCRSDRAGVTSYIRILGLDGKAYHRFLHLFHTQGLDLDRLTDCWVRLCLALFQPMLAGSRLVCLADGIKAPKEGKKMPAVKMLHQQSASNSKPEYIMGHSFQAISMLVQGASGHVAAVPLTSRIHEGLVFSNRDTRTLLDKLAALLFSIANVLGRKVLLVADAYYASGKFIGQLLANGHQLVTRAKSNAVAYRPAPRPALRRLPFRIELGFRQAVHVLGAYAYHFWMWGMKPLRRGDGNQYLHRTSDAYRAATLRKMRAFHLHVQLECIAQGLLQHLAINHTAEVWRAFRSWLRTMNPALPPSELVTANALRAGIPELIFSPGMDPNLKIILYQYRHPDIHSGSGEMAA